jgi:UDP-N-acetylglucosamine--N-acetylmuramyl-(pentapeptide) pyrophosphoryl-undecaprenol N-acetylglucosamine transferase
MSRARTALIMAGGTGGHIFPGLALAQGLRQQGWQVHWLGAPASMESELVPPQGFAFESIAFSGVRGKGLKRLWQLPLQLWQALRASRQVLLRVQPDVVVGFGGYISFPAGLMAALMGKPLVLHEQNAIAGLANRVLSVLAKQVFTAFPGALSKGLWIGNPLRAAFINAPPPAQRYAGRSGPLRLLVVGGSLGAQALNLTVPEALGLLPVDQRPVVVHQGGAKQMGILQAAYLQAGVQADLRPFIEHMAEEMLAADVIICRSGASTVTEVAALGAPCVLVPFPHAVDDHQTANARFLSDAGAAVLMPQAQMTPQSLATLMQQWQRNDLLTMAEKAYQLAQREATLKMIQACEQLSAT